MENHFDDYVNAYIEFAVWQLFNSASNDSGIPLAGPSNIGPSNYPISTVETTTSQFPTLDTGSTSTRPARSLVERTDDNRWQCCVCGRKFVRRLNCERHSYTHLPPEERPKHIGQRDSPIPTVDTATSEFPTLDTGSTSTRPARPLVESTDDKRWQCCVCGRKFGRRFNCERHFYTHLPPEERPQLPCPLPPCRARCAQKSDLEVHVRNVHKRCYVAGVLMPEGHPLPPKKERKKKAPVIEASTADNSKGEI